MNNKFEKWIEESAPVVVMNSSKKDFHLAVLKQRLRDREVLYRKRQLQKQHTGIATVVLVLVLIGGSVSELGSDGFDFVVPDYQVTPSHERVDIGFRGARMSILGGETHEEVREFAMLSEGRIGIPVGVTAYEFQGSENWSMGFEYQAGDHKRVTHQAVLDRPSVVTMDFFQFLKTEDDLLTGQIEEGTLRPVSIQVEEIDGFHFLIKKYSYRSERYGTVIYKRGALVNRPSN